MTDAIGNVEMVGMVDMTKPPVLGAELLTLGIDTSTVVCAGLVRGGEALASGTVEDTHAHVEQLIPMIRRLLADCGLAPVDLGRVAVGVGPGPFTGLRVGVVAAQVLAEALSIPVRGVCSLDVLAVQAVESGVAADAQNGFVVVSDARRHELYWATYDAAGRRTGGPSVSAPGDVPALPAYGPGAGLYPLAGGALDSAGVLDAGVLARVAWELPDAGLEPLYLRRPDADVPTARKSTLPRPRLNHRVVRS